MEKIWAENIATSEALKKYADQPRRAVRAAIRRGRVDAVFPAVQANAWLLHDGGKAKVSPDTVGIPSPDARFGALSRA